MEGAASGSPYLLDVHWSKNIFETCNVVGPAPIGVVNQGSYPNEPVAPGSSQAKPLPIPPGWVERSYDFLYEGDEDSERNVWLGADWNKAVSKVGPFMVDGGGVPVNPTTRVIVITGPMPSWFKK